MIDLVYEQNFMCVCVPYKAHFIWHICGLESSDVIAAIF